MDFQENKRAIIVGLFIALGLILFIVGVLTFGTQQKSFSNGVHIRAVFTDVNGLMKGNNVWFSGVKVGTVSSIKFGGISQVVVSMNIDKTAKQFIHQNAGVRVSAEGFIGNKIVVIEGGTPNAPAIEDGDVLHAEALLSTDDIMKTLQRNNVNLLAITSDFKQLSHNIVQGKGTVGALMSDSVLAQRFRSVVEELHNTTASTARMAEQLNVYSAKLNRKGTLANDLATDTATYKHFETAVRQLQDATARASAFTDNINRASSKLNTTDNALGLLLNDRKSAAQVQSTLNYLQQSSVKLNDDLEAVQHNFLLKGFFKKKEKRKEDSLKNVTKIKQ